MEGHMEKLTRDYAVTKDQLLGRLVRIEGQVRGISRMVHDDRPCVDVLTQISAVHAALDKVALGLLDRHVRLSLVARQSAGSGTENQADEVMGAVSRLVSR
jgi:CsoR family transcriptional regulator, copper-sensing transcriptional repressor